MKRRAFWGLGFLGPKDFDPKKHTLSGSVLGFKGVRGLGFLGSRRACASLCRRVLSLSLRFI